MQYEPVFFYILNKNEQYKVPFSWYLYIKKVIFDQKTGKFFVRTVQWPNTQCALFNLNIAKLVLILIMANLTTSSIYWLSGSQI